MIASCPQCHARYRLAAEQVSPSGARLRCTRCDNVFRVVTREDPPQSSPDASVRAKPEPVSSSSPTTRAVVVEADREVAKKIGAYLERSNISPSFVADGGDALLRILRSPPELVVIGGQLRGLPSRALVEIVRRSPQLAALKLVRVASTNALVSASLSRSSQWYGT